MGPALSRVLLDQVAAGRRPATVRLSRPGRVVAFGRRDVVSPGYRDAVAAAARSGFPGMERLAGGRAAAFTEGALSLTFTVPDPRPAERTNQRFDELTGLVRDAFAELGVDARIGAVPGEYCPGEFSLNAGDRIKLAGVGQRMIKGAAHVGYVILVSGSELVAELLGPVYEALGLEYSRRTVGSLEDENPGIGRGEVEDSLLKRLRLAADLEPTDLDRQSLEEAESRAADFRSPPPSAIG
jgi:lipoate-protein ligase A